MDHMFPYGPLNASDVVMHSCVNEGTAGDMMQVCLEDPWSHSLTQGPFIKYLGSERICDNDGDCSENGRWCRNPSRRRGPEYSTRGDIETQRIVRKYWWQQARRQQQQKTACSHANEVAQLNARIDRLEAKRQGEKPRGQWTIWSRQEEVAQHNASVERLEVQLRRLRVSEPEDEEMSDESEEEMMDAADDQMENSVDEDNQLKDPVDQDWDMVDQSQEEGGSTPASDRYDSDERTGGRNDGYMMSIGDRYDSDHPNRRAWSSAVKVRSRDGLFDR